MTIRAEPIASGASVALTSTQAPTVKTRKNVPISSTTYLRPATAARLATARRAGMVMVLIQCDAASLLIGIPILSPLCSDAASGSSPRPRRGRQSRSWQTQSVGDAGAEVGVDLGPVVVDR